MSETAWQRFERLLEGADSVDGQARLIEYIATEQPDQLTAIYRSFRAEAALHPQDKKKLTDYLCIFARVAEVLRQAETGRTNMN